MELDWNSIIIALITGASVGIPTSIIAWRTHTAVNSRMTEFLIEFEKKNIQLLKSAVAQAILSEKVAEQHRKDTPVE